MVALAMAGALAAAAAMIWREYRGARDGVFARRALYGAGFDNAALPMGAIAEFVMLPVLTLVLGAVALGPLAAVRAKVPARVRARPVAHPGRAVRRR